MNTILIILVGRSASGKTVTSNQIYDTLSSSGIPVNRVVTATTRPPRDNEKDGVDYYFLPKSQFLDMMAYNNFIEFATFNGWYYGTPEFALEQDKINILVLNPEGVQTVVNNPGKLPVGTQVFVFDLIVPLRIRLKRMIARDGHRRENIRRLWADHKDFSWFDYRLDEFNPDIGYPMTENGSKRKLEFYFRKIKGLPESTLCDRIIEKVMRKRKDS